MKKTKPNWLQNLVTFFKLSSRWLAPGLGVKRWLIVILAGITLIGVGLAILILHIYRTAPDTWWLPILSAASLRILARPWRAVIFGGLGIGLLSLGLWRLNRALMAPYLSGGRPVLDTLTSYRRRERGPKTVVIGGGHGLAILLRGLKDHTNNITAVVSVADDGGSSGMLRRARGILPPGDIRNCLAALSNDEALLSQLFQYRFPDSDDGLDGHSFGNLFISALAEITGSFEEAVAESGRVLAVHGRVLPATLHDVRLVADVALPHGETEIRVEGESEIPKTAGRVHRLWLEPHDAPAYPDVIQAILSADLIMVGPGSLYTSLLPNLLVEDLTAAIRASKALKIYICNLATQPGETDGYTCGDHVHAIEEHVGTDLFDIIVTNEYFEANLPPLVEWVQIDDDLALDHAVYRAELVDLVHPWRHDAVKLAQVIIDLYQERTGPLLE